MCVGSYVFVLFLRGGRTVPPPQGFAVLALEARRS